MLGKKKTLSMLLSFTMLFGMFAATAGTGRAAADEAPVSPGKIEIEDFENMSGIKTDALPGGTDQEAYIGWTDAGDWMDYRLNVAQDGLYRIELRVASPLDTSKLQIKNEADQVKATVNIPKTGATGDDWFDWLTLSADVNLSAGSQLLRIYVLSAGFNIDWMNITYLSEPVPEEENPEEPAPEPRELNELPGKVKAESYGATRGGAKGDSTDASESKAVSLPNAGDWIDFPYAHAAQGGTYDISFRVASGSNDKQLKLENAFGDKLGEVTVPNTGGEDTWQTVTASSVTLPAGVQTLRVSSPTGGVRLEWLNAELVTPVSNTRPEPANALNIVEDCGAIANDDLDDTDAIQACIDQAKAETKTVYVPEGKFLYSAILTLDGVDLTGAGPASILHSTNLAEQCLQITGDGTDVSYIRLTTVRATQRLSTDVSARIYVDPEASHFTIKHTEIDGASSAGIINFGANGVISDNFVANTLADGIHNTGLSHDLVIENNICRDNGDDQIAVVSYEKNSGWVKNVTISHNDVAGGLARGITLSGGEKLTVENNRISTVGGAGIFLASEGSYQTYTVKDATVSGNTVINDSQNGSVPEKGGLRLQATYKNPSIQNGLFENNHFYGSADSGILVVGTAVIDNAVFNNNVIEKPAAYGISLVKTVIGNLTFAGNTVKDSGKAAFSNLASGATVVSDMTNEGSGEEGPQSDYVAVNATPVIDGEVDKLWKYSTALQMGASASGTTGTVRIAWDEDALYYLFDMKDSTPFAEGTDEKNDSVEVWVDELNAKHGARSTGDYQARLGLDDVLSTASGLDLTNVPHKVTATEDGYIAEFAVPYTALTPAVGKLIGFNASANDDANGDGQRDDYISWIDKNLPYWADTKVYNEVELIGTPASTLPQATKGKPVIDGQVDKLWSHSTTLQMSDTPKGTTGTAKIAWDEDALYYLFQMKDSTPFATAANENNDSVEVWTDELNTKNGSRTIGDYQLRLDLNDVLSTAADLDLSSVTHKVVPTSNGYIAEFAVPYTELSPQVDSIIGFNASANDDENGDGKRDNYISWIDKNLPYWADTKVYNEVALAKAAADPDPQPNNSTPYIPLPDAATVISTDANGAAVVVPQASANAQDGSVSAAITAQDWEKALKAAKPDADGSARILIDLKGTGDSQDYALKLPSGALSRADGEAVHAEVRTSTATITLSNEMFEAGVLTASDVTLRIRQVDASSLDAGVKAKIGNHPVVSLEFQVNGQTVAWNNAEAPVTVSIPYKPSAEELSNPELLVIWYIDGRGLATPVTNGHYDAQTGTMTFETTHFSQYAVVYETPSFTDIGALGWANKQIAALAAKGILNGMSEGKFSPLSNVKRADFVVMLIRALGLNAAPGASFDDVSAQDGFSQAVGTARTLGIVNGAGDNRFLPGALITREDMLVMADRAMIVARKLNANQGTDEALGAVKDAGAIAGYAEGSISRLLHAGLIQGSGGMVMPKAMSNRAQAAVLIYNLIHYPSGTK